MQRDSAKHVVGEELEGDGVSEDAAAGPPRLRVSWLELFYDLSFVVVIAQLAERLHGEPSPLEILATFGLFLVAWAAWFNSTALTNISGGIQHRGRVLILISMAGVGVMAVGMNPHTHQLALVAVGYAIIRTALAPLWARQRHSQGLSASVPLLIGAANLVGWLGSLLVPEPWRWLVWVGLVIADGVTATLRRSHAGRLQFEGGHLMERVGLFTMITFGESVALVIAAVADDDSSAGWWTAAASFFVLCSLFLLFYDIAMDRMEDAVHDDPGLAGYFVNLGQLVVVAGLIALAAGFSDAVHAAQHHERLSELGRWLAAGGVSLVSVGALSLTVEAGIRKQQVTRGHRLLTLAWMLVGGIGVPVLLALLGGELSPAVFLVCLGLFPSFVVTYTAQQERRRLARSAA